MQLSYSRGLMLAVLTLPLGACSSFLGMHFARHTPKAVAPVEMAAKQDSATDLGRRQLADGQTGLAIESFQRALAASEPIAPAVNGLGVAYARIGRFDLAQRFFQEAMAADPAQTRYSDNFAKLMRSPALALRRDADIAGAAFSPTEPDNAAVQRAQPTRSASAVPEPGRLQRVSRWEVRIVTAPPQAAPAARAGIEVDKRFRPIVRFSLAGDNAPPPQAFVRIKLADQPAPGQDVKTAAAPAR